LGGSHYIAVYGKVFQKCIDFFFTHIFGMYFVVKKDIPPYPLHVTLLSPNAVVHGTDRLPNLVQKPWLSCFEMIMIHFWKRL
jgi:hypothetical protein